MVDGRDFSAVVESKRDTACEREVFLVEVHIRTVDLQRGDEALEMIREVGSVRMLDHQSYVGDWLDGPMWDVSG